MTTLQARRLPPAIMPIEPSDLIWLAFTLSVAASIVPIVTGGVAGPLAGVVAVVGSGGCGWLWFLSRSLFRKEKPIERWNIYTIVVIVAVEGTSNLIGANLTSGPKPEMYRIIGNAEAFICIGALVMVFAEVLSDYGNDLNKQELRFRQIFILMFGVMIALTLLWVLNADKNSLGGQWKEPVLISTALIGIVGTRLCIFFRKQNPLSSSKKPKLVGDRILAKRIIQTLQQDGKFTIPELKVADLAEILEEHEYKVSQCITGTLGYRNFNHLINSHRIDSAKEALANPDNKEHPILSVAFDCGFNSVGPFNRAFKRQVGMTPREYRAAVE